MGHDIFFENSLCVCQRFGQLGGGYIIIGVEEENGRPVYPLKDISAEKLDAYQKEIFAKCKLIQLVYMPIIDAVDYLKQVNSCWLVKT